eukprot:scaffold758_cov177-Amphora_coffeaeformis.AAC.3
MATTHPMKNPTASDEWNFLIIIVPPTDRAHSINPDQSAARPSENLREPMTKMPRMNKILAKDMKQSRHQKRLSRNERAYHHPAINLRDDPPQRDSAR